jgi:hypothetical protein
MVAAPSGAAVMPNIEQLALDLLLTNPAASVLPLLANKKIGWLRGDLFHKTTLSQPLIGGD